MLAGFPDQMDRRLQFLSLSSVAILIVYRDDVRKCTDKIQRPRYVWHKNKKKILMLDLTTIFNVNKQYFYKLTYRNGFM